MGTPTSLGRLVSYIVPCLLSFYAGALWGANACLEHDLDLVADKHFPILPTTTRSFNPDIASPVGKEIDHEMKDDSPPGKHLGEESAKKQRRIPASMKRIADGIARTSKEDFVKLFDFGIPYDRPQKDMADVLRTYEKSYPFGWLAIMSETRPLHDIIYANHECGFTLASQRNERLSRSRK